MKLRFAVCLLAACLSVVKKPDTSPGAPLTKSRDNTCAWPLLSVSGTRTRWIIMSDPRRWLPTSEGIHRKSRKSSSRQRIGGRLAALPGLQGDDQVRRQFLLGQLTAIAARADLLCRLKRSQVPASFDQEAHAFFGVERAPHANPRLDLKLDNVRQQLAKLLPGKGTLVDRYAAFEKRFLIPEQRMPAVLSRSLELCREQTLSHIKLPAGESVRLEFVQDKPWSGYSYYQGRYQSVIQINADLGLTVDRALQLACHEGYPGHHAFNSLAEQNLAVAKHRTEWLVQPAFSPQSFLSEAAATVAGELAFSDSERMHVEEDVLFPLAGLKSADVKNYLKIEHLVDVLHPAELAIAREYLDSGWSSCGRQARYKIRRLWQTRGDAAIPQ